MATTPIRTVWGAITDFLATEPSPEAIIAYRLPDDLQQRADALFERNGEDLLTPEEYDEMLQLMNADEMISLLKAKMRLRMQDQ